jgi:hypothetical protein
MNKKERNKDSDFGFPFVEIKPISRENALNSDSSLTPSATDHSTTIAIKKKNTEALKPRKSSSKIYLGLGFLILLLVVSAYFLFNTNRTINLKDNPISLEKDNVSSPNANLNQDQTIVEEVQSDTNELEIIPEASIVSIKERLQGRYFLVVSSLINEELAILEAQKFLELGSDVYVIYPYGENTNYRIALEKFETIESATMALDQAQKEINKSTWILKY